jgi:hypothetical protein
MTDTRSRSSRGSKRYDRRSPRMRRCGSAGCDMASTDSSCTATGLTAGRLERPLRNLLTTPTIDSPFALRGRTRTDAAVDGLRFRGPHHLRATARAGRIALRRHPPRAQRLALPDRRRSAAACPTASGTQERARRSNDGRSVRRATASPPAMSRCRPFMATEGLPRGTETSSTASSSSPCGHRLHPSGTLRTGHPRASRAISTLRRCGQQRRSRDDRSAWARIHPGLCRVGTTPRRGDSAYVFHGANWAVA